MKNFKKLILESNFNSRFISENEEDDYLDSFDDQEENRNHRLLIAHAMVDGKTALMHMEQIPFTYTTANNKKLIFKNINHAGGALAHSLTSHGYAAGAIAPLEEHGGNFENIGLITNNIRSKHQDFINELKNTHKERSRELYRRDEMFRSAMDVLSNNYGVPHDQIYDKVFEDHLLHKHIDPRVKAFNLVHSVRGEDARRQAIEKLNDNILSFGGTMGVIANAPKPPRIETA